MARRAAVEAGRQSVVGTASVASRVAGGAGGVDGAKRADVEVDVDQALTHVLLLFHVN